jgi:hypothetical protein
MVAERHHDDGKERRQFELIERAEEGKRELESEGGKVRRAKGGVTRFF